MAPSPEPTTPGETSTEEPIRRGAAPVESTSELEDEGDPEPPSAPVWPPASLEDDD
jgi:hypothetical protein